MAGLNEQFCAGYVGCARSQWRVSPRADKTLRMDLGTKQRIWRMTFNEAFKYCEDRAIELTAAEQRGADASILDLIREEIAVAKQVMERKMDDPDGSRAKGRKSW